MVLEDADLDEAAKTGARARSQNSGQSCIAAKRFVVVDDAYEDFVDRPVAETDALQVGDPMDAATDVGPLAAESFVREVPNWPATSRQGAYT